MSSKNKTWFFGLIYKPGSEKDLISHSMVGLDTAANLFQWNTINGLIKADIGDL